MVRQCQQQAACLGSISEEQGHQYGPCPLPPAVLCALVAAHQTLPGLWHDGKSTFAACFGVSPCSGTTGAGPLACGKPAAHQPVLVCSSGRLVPPHGEGRERVWSGAGGGQEPSAQLAASGRAVSVPNAVPVLLQAARIASPVTPWGPGCTCCTLACSFGAPLSSPWGHPRLHPSWLYQ